VWCLQNTYRKGVVLDFICKGCDSPAVADDYDDIVKRKKLCDSCISENNTLNRARTKPKKSGKKAHSSGKKSKVFTFVCNNCSRDSGRDKKPWSCDQCNKNSFRRVEKTKEK